MWLYRNLNKKTQIDETIMNSKTEITSRNQKNRIESIDALRGFDMIWIVGGAWVIRDIIAVWKNSFTEFIGIQLEHTHWYLTNINGRSIHFWDVIWPLFLFIVGLVLPLSISRQIHRGKSHLQLYLKFLKRMLLLIILGWVYRGLLQFDWVHMNYTSVLGDIGIAYFFAAIIVLNTKRSTQAIIIVVVLLLYWVAIMFIPVPKYGAGVLTPKGNFMTYVDNLLLPHGSAFRFKDTTGVLMPLLTMTCTVLIGSLAGQLLSSKRSSNQITVRLTLAGIGCIIVGYLWGYNFPLFKPLWTSSYVLYTSGWSLLLLSLFYWLIDVKGYKKWTLVFNIIGANALAIYIANHLINFRLIASIFVGGLARISGQWNGTIIDFSRVTIEWLLLWHLYRYKIYIKI